MRNKLFLLSITLSLLLSLNSFSQVSEQWLSTYSGNGNNADEAHSLAVDGMGNIYVTGSSTGSGTGRDYSTIKYNSAGAQQWAARYNGEGVRDDFANAIAVDISGNVYVTGWSNKITTGRDYATIKYNSMGDSVWVRRYSGLSTSFNDEASSISVDLSGNVYVTGYSVNGINSDYATIKYNSSGVQQWVSRYDGPGNGVDNASSLVVDGNGNVYVTGLSVGVSTGGDYVTIKYNSSGVQQWTSRYFGQAINLADAATAIVVDGTGNIYVTGYSAGNGTGLDYATIKYNSSGVQQWASRYVGPGSDAAFSIGVDSSGNVFVTGASLGIGTMEDYATVKYNSLGVEQWASRYNGAGGNVTDRAYSLALDGSGNVYVTGESNGDGGDYFEYATVKYNSSGDSVWVKGYGRQAAGHDRGYKVAVDGTGNVFVTGKSVSGGTGDDYVTIKYSQSPYAAITGFIEGFYNSSSDKMVSDTALVFLRNAISPYAKIDSSKSKLDSTGKGRFYFSNVYNGTNYFIILNHRNSIETWSSNGSTFVSGAMSYDFSTNANKAYGNNMKQVDDVPVRFAIYNGDVNQDGSVDITDGSLIDNDIYDFVSGYVAADLNGDNAVDVSDAAILDNNAFNFVSKITP